MRPVREHGSERHFARIHNVRVVGENRLGRILNRLDFLFRWRDLLGRCEVDEGVVLQLTLLAVLLLFFACTQQSHGTHAQTGTVHRLSARKRTTKVTASTTRQYAQRKPSQHNTTQSKKESDTMHGRR